MPARPVPKRLILLGSTGSIGRQTVEVVANLNALADAGHFDRRYEIVGLAAGNSADSLFAQSTTLDVREVAIASEPDAELRAVARARGINLRVGECAAEQLVREVEADVVLGAIVGSAGLRATLAAAELGRDIALANKETLVAAGALVTQAAQRTSARLMPVDSEHSAIWQCLAGPDGATLCPPCSLDERIARIVLTASGGALRDRPRDKVYNATPADALAHPTWSMGAKVTVDSASLTNKALEVIEAHWLFGVESARIGVLIHPQSIVHSFVEYADKSVIAQCGAPDMKTPIQYALTFPARASGCSRPLDWTALRRLDFDEPDLERFPALALGFRVVDEGGTSGAVFNAANEAAVDAFLNRRIPFGRIAELSAGAMDEVGHSSLRNLDDAFAADAEARRFVRAQLNAAPVA